MSEEIATIQDVRKARFCGKGLKKWCEDHGIDLRDAIKNGIPAETLRQMNDGQANRVLEKMRERLSRGR